MFEADVAAKAVHDLSAMSCATGLNLRRWTAHGPRILEGLHVRGGAVAFVLCETVARVLHLKIVRHDAVARHFGDDRRCRD